MILRPVRLGTLLSLVVLLGCTVIPVAGEPSFASLLLDSSTETIELSSQSVGSGFDSYLYTPYQLKRNVTVSGVDGTDTILDLAFLHGVVQLCSTCTFIFRNITIANERRGNDSPIDFFSGRPGSIIKLEHVNRLRLACAAAPDSGTVVDVTPRSKLLPNTTMRQEFDVGSVTFQGRVFPSTLSTKDYTADIPLDIQEDRPPLGGYALSAQFMHRLCKNTISKDCLAKKSTAVCVDELIDAIQAGEAATPAKSVPVAAIVAPIVVATVVLLAALAAGLFCIRKRRRQRQQQQQDKQQQQQVLAAGSVAASGKSAGSLLGQRGSGSSAVAAGDVVLTVRDDDSSCGGTAVAAGAAAAAAGFVGAAALSPTPARSSSGRERAGWQRSCCIVSPALGEVANPKIRFGDLLGAGSFGRVFQGTFQGRVVAVKVMEHAVTKEVEQEVRLMMGLDSDFIVRAYFFVTYRHNESDEAADASFASSEGDIGGSSVGRSLRHRARMRRSMELQQQQQQPAMSPRSLLDADASPAGSSSGNILVAPRGGGGGLSTGRLSDSAMAHHNPISTQLGLPAAAGAGGEGVCLSSQQSSPRSRQLPVAHPSNASLATSPGSASSRPGSRSDTLAARADATGTTAADGAGDHSAAAMPMTPQKAESHLVMEFCDKGTLAQVLFSLRQQQSNNKAAGAAAAQDAASADQEQPQSPPHPGKTPPPLLPLLLLLLRDVACGLQQLHSSKIVHGDLNARNVLVSSSRISQGVPLTAKLADFGLSRTLRQHQTHRTTQTLGTISHMPPELLQDGKMSAGVDIYAFGIMMHELWTGVTAFKNLHFGAFYSKVVLQGGRPPVPAGVPAGYEALMTRCWQTEPHDRPTAEQLLQALTDMLDAAQGAAAPQPSQPQQQQLVVRQAPADEAGVE